eukprot:CAMPEP_0201891508 /NCGR_PEP_ID=MMETSP0902-20130614/34585_1 /ASSEMBLY_ACC=CAM_ASM_000551 /TAXON_ID=420261 /ORGANISM="Thalassiosira antarctica, Strain CCMP982" /LENGTH=68 /DNA_ID=CAMNT_0048422731 /DNA_START=531 /DNA_END=737 /DNA_ORIENTATION=-
MVGTGKEKKIEAVKHYIPLQDICLDDLPKVGGETRDDTAADTVGRICTRGFGVSMYAYDGKICIALLV